MPTTRRDAQSGGRNPALPNSETRPVRFALAGAVPAARRQSLRPALQLAGDVTEGVAEIRADQGERGNRCAEQPSEIRTRH
jgi:hypothetical protein